MGALNALREFLVIDIGLFSEIWEYKTGIGSKYRKNAVLNLD